MNQRFNDGLCRAFQSAHPAAVASLADAPRLDVSPTIGFRWIAAKGSFDFGGPILRHGVNYPNGPEVFSVELFPAAEDALSHGYLLHSCAMMGA